jgi:hypothetical protein
MGLPGFGSWGGQAFNLLLESATTQEENWVEDLDLKLKVCLYFCQVRHYNFSIDRIKYALYFLFLNYIFCNNKSFS